MKAKLYIAMVVLLIIAGSAVAQNTVKLFDATAVTPSSTASAWNPRTPMIFNEKDVYLSCPVGGNNTTYLTGPNNGSLIVDDFFTVNGNNVCPDEWDCFAGLLAAPATAIGLPTDTVYLGVPPIDISNQITGSGTYTFLLSDYGFDYGSSEIYLHTSCSFGTYVCHHNNGKSAPKTLAVGTNAVAAHLAHGDSEGPCND
jgi:hypothetical protein